MTQDRAAHKDQNRGIPTEPNLGSTYYALIGLTPSASVQEIRRAYRELSKLYHPDTTDLPTAIATQKFQQLNEAYATLSNPERRLNYDRKIGFSRVHVIQPSQSLRSPSQTRSGRVSTYQGPSDRPLSPGELFALFILGITFVACLVLAIAVGLTHGETAFRPSLSSSPAIVQPTITPSPAQSTDNDQSAAKDLQPSHDQTQNGSITQPVVHPSTTPVKHQSPGMSSVDQTQDSNACVGDPASA